MISTELRGSICAMLSGFLYGFIGYFGVSLMQASFSVSNMLFWRFLISSLFMGVFILVRTKHYEFTVRKLVITFLNGAVFYAISTIFYFLACPYIGSGLSMVIFFTYPAMIILLNYFFYGQHIPPIYYIAILIIIAGMPFFVDVNDMRFDLLGIIFSVISALLYAAYIISSKKVSNLSPNLSTLMICLGCTVTSFITALATDTFVVPTTLHIWSHLLGISLLSTAVPILLLLYSLNYISAEKASILSVLEPVFVVFFGVLLLGEPMKLQYALGVSIVLSGALLTLFSQQIRMDTGKGIATTE